MADELGIDATNYSRLERGESKIPIERLAKIAVILETDLSALITENDFSELKLNDKNVCTLLLGILLEVRAIRESLSIYESKTYNLSNAEIDSNSFSNLQNK